MNLLSLSLFCFCLYPVLADEPIVLLKDSNNTPKSSETSKEKAVKQHSDSIDSYTSGLTPQFRNLLLAPDSREAQQPKKSSKNISQKERNSHDEKSDLNNVFEGIPQAHLDQLLRYYGKIAGKLSPPGYAKFRKITTEKDKSDEPAGETKETTTETPSSESKPVVATPEHVVNKVVNNAIIANTAALAALQASSNIPVNGYGSLNYLNAASYGPPLPTSVYTAALRNKMLASNYLSNQGAYGPPNCCNLCSPCTSQPIYENSCAGINNANNMGISGITNGCSGSDYTTNAETDDGYGPDNYYNSGGYGTNNQPSQENGGSSSSSPIQLLSPYASPSTQTSASVYGSSKQQPGTYYQVSSPNSLIVDSHPYSPTRSIFGTSHMHHFGSYPTLNSNPFQQYYGAFNSYPTNHNFNYGASMSDMDLGAQSLYDYNDRNAFGPMFDYAVTSETESTSVVPKTTPKSKEDTRQVESVFHIVKPNFASLKKAALMKKHRASSTAKPQTGISSTTQNIIIARKISKIIASKKSSTPTNTTNKAPESTTISTTTHQITESTTSKPN